MQIVTSVAQARALFDALPRPLGFVPTMGALHDGHVQLLRYARERSASVAVSIFVNPLQFGPSEDFAGYPRTLVEDQQLLRDAQCDLLFAPSVEELYPDQGTQQTVVSVRGEAPVSGPLVFSPDGKRFAIGVVGQPYTTYGVRVYDWPHGKPLQTFLGHRGPVASLRFTADGHFLATGAHDTSVLLWDLTKLGDGK